MLIGTADDDDEVKALRDFTVVTQCTDYGFVSPPFEKKKTINLTWDQIHAPHSF